MSIEGRALIGLREGERFEGGGNERYRMKKKKEEGGVGAVANFDCVSQDQAGV